MKKDSKNIESFYITKEDSELCKVITYNEMCEFAADVNITSEHVRKVLKRQRRVTEAFLPTWGKIKEFARNKQNTQPC